MRLKTFATLIAAGGALIASGLWLEGLAGTVLQFCGYAVGAGAGVYTAESWRERRAERRRNR